MGITRRTDLVRMLMLAGLLAALALRLYRLGADSLWYDETVSAFLARQTPAAILQRTAGDIHPPGYYLLLHGWRLISRPTPARGLEFLLAWPSLWWGMLIVALAGALGRQLFDRRVALLSIWLAAVNPFHIWYGQEVRMYTQGAALGLFALWLAQRWLRDGRGRWLVGYGITAALALYTLYFSAFLLVGLTAAVGWQLLQTRRPETRQRLVFWLGAQLLALALYTPWLPILWRQATAPPVPPWRGSWQGLGDMVAALGDGFAALVAGQSPPLTVVWPWALLTVGLLLLGLLPAARRRAGERTHVVSLVMVILLPMALLIGLSATVTPLYHVRYLFISAPVFVLVAAVAVDQLARRRRWLGGALLALILLTAAGSLQRFWHDPALAADDHRGAVAALAAAWRPGDLILVNAGWAFTALDTYWPVELTGPWDALPPPIGGTQRLSVDAHSPAPGGSGAPAKVMVVRTGSVDGAETLGWGAPESDFFAVSGAETTAGLAHWAAVYATIWHYRIYDTVSDPNGLIRSWLESRTTMTSDAPFPGRDFLRVQRFDTGLPLTDPPQESATFGHLVTVESHGPLASTPAGAILYTTLAWRWAADATPPQPELRTSLRLYDSSGTLWSQRDDPLAISASPNGTVHRLQSALPLPAAVPPGRYHVDLIVYRGGDGEALSVPDSAHTIDGQRWRLGEVEVQPAAAVFTPSRQTPTFDYIDLLETAVSRHAAAAGSAVDVTLVWHPRPAPYQDGYDSVITLAGSNGEVVQRWSEPAGSAAYPSSIWPTGSVVGEQRRLVLDPALPAGDYQLHVHLERSRDRLAIPAQTGLLRRQRPTAPLGPLTITP